MQTNSLHLPVGVYATAQNTTDWFPHNTWTVEFWAKITTAGTSVGIVDANPWATVFFNASSLTVSIGSAGGVQILATGWNPWAADHQAKWHHYAVTRDTARQIVVYVDGSPITGPSVTTNVTGSNSVVTVGALGSHNGDVEVGDIRVWNYARTQADIQNSRNNWLDGNDNGLVANWTFPEGDNILTTTGDMSWWPAPKPAQFNLTMVGAGYAFNNDCPVSIATKLDPETPPVTARLDYGAQAIPYHLPMILGNVMEIFGLNADVFDESIFNNDYSQIYPEYQISQVPIKTIKVLISQPFGGIMMSDYISITQNVTKEFKIVSNSVIKEQQILRVRFPDQRTVNLRVVADLALHPLSALQYTYECVFV